MLRLNDQFQIVRPPHNTVHEDPQNGPVIKQLALHRLGASTTGTTRVTIQEEIRGISKIKLVGIAFDTLAFTGTKPNVIHMKIKTEGDERILGDLCGNVSDKSGVVIYLQSTTLSNYYQAPLLVQRFKNYEGRLKSWVITLVDVAGVAVTWTNLDLLFEVELLYDQ